MVFFRYAHAFFIRFEDDHSQLRLEKGGLLVPLPLSGDPSQLLSGFRRFVVRVCAGHFSYGDPKDPEPSSELTERVWYQEMTDPRSRWITLHYTDGRGREQRCHCQRSELVSRDDLIDFLSEAVADYNRDLRRSPTPPPSPPVGTEEERTMQTPNHRGTNYLGQIRGAILSDTGARPEDPLTLFRRTWEQRRLQARANGPSQSAPARRRTVAQSLGASVRQIVRRLSIVVAVRRSSLTAKAIHGPLESLRADEERCRQAKITALTIFDGPSEEPIETFRARIRSAFQAAKLPWQGIAIRTEAIIRGLQAAGLASATNLTLDCFSPKHLKRWIEIDTWWAKRIELDRRSIVLPADLLPQPITLGQRLEHRLATGQVVRSIELPDDQFRWLALSSFRGWNSPFQLRMLATAATRGTARGATFQRFYDLEAAAIDVGLNAYVVFCVAVGAPNQAAAERQLYDHLMATQIIRACNAMMVARALVRHVVKRCSVRYDGECATYQLTIESVRAIRRNSLSWLSRLDKEQRIRQSGAT